VRPVQVTLTAAPSPDLQADTPRMSPRLKVKVALCPGAQLDRRMVLWRYSSLLLTWAPVKLS
jgi:hypothetical protein